MQPIEIQRKPYHPPQLEQLPNYVNMVGVSLPISGSSFNPVTELLGSSVQE